MGASLNGGSIQPGIPMMGTPPYQGLCTMGAPHSGSLPHVGDSVQCKLPIVGAPYDEVS